MILKPLKWDSDFYGIRIARIDVDSTDVESDVRKVFSQNERNYDLIYIFSDEKLDLKQNDKCKLVDTKVVYSGVMDIVLTDAVGVKEYADNIPSAQLYKLSYISGKYSRFKTDCKFKSGDFERLYGKWIENSVNKTFADKVLCYYDERNIERGMVTVKFSDNVCSIGLIAVDDDFQSQGIGKRLMAAVKNEMRLNGIEFLEVATQKENKVASRFYENCGLKVKIVSRVYHYWCSNE